MVCGGDDVDHETLLRVGALLVVAERFASHASVFEFVSELLVIDDAIEAKANVESASSPLTVASGIVAAGESGDVAALSSVRQPTAAEVTIEGASSQKLDESSLGQDGRPEIKGGLDPGCVGEALSGDCVAAKPRRTRELGGEGHVIGQIILVRHVDGSGSI